MALRWSEIENSVDYQQADPESRKQQRIEFLSKVRPEMSPEGYKILEDRVMIKEQPSNQYGTSQPEPSFPAAPFDVSAGFQYNPQQDQFPNIPTVPAPTTSTTPGAPEVMAQTIPEMTRDMKWTDFQQTDIYKFADKKGRRNLANDFIVGKSTTDISPEGLAVLSKKINESLDAPEKISPPQPINEPMGTQPKTPLPEDIWSWEGLKKGTKAALGLEPGLPGKGTGTLGITKYERTPEQLNAMAEEDSNKFAMEQMLATEQEIKASRPSGETVLAEQLMKSQLYVSMPLIGLVSSLMQDPAPKTKTMMDVDALPGPDFFGALINPGEIPTNMYLGATLAPTKTLAMRALGAIDGAFNGLPRLAGGLHGMARNMIRYAKGASEIARRTGMNPGLTLDAVESHIASLYQEFASSKAVKEGRATAADLLTRNKEEWKNTFQALKKYAADNGFSPEETRALLRFGSTNPNYPTSEANLRPFSEALVPPEATPPIQGELPLPLPKATPVELGGPISYENVIPGETLPERIPQQLQLPIPGVTEAELGGPIRYPLKTFTPPPLMEDVISSGLAEEQLHDVLTITNRRLEKEPSTLLGRATKAWRRGERHPIRFFEQAGGNIKEKVYDPIQDGHDRTVRELWDRFLPRVKELRKKTDGNRIGYFMISNDPTGQGRKTLADMGINVDKELSKMTAKEIEVANEYSKYYEELFHRINSSRIQSGLNPIGKKDNYITFFRQMDWMKENLGYDILSRADLDNDILSHFINFNSTVFKQARERGKNTSIPIATDAHAIFMKYASSALDHINMTPPIHNGQRLLTQIKDTDPKLYSEARHWLNFIAGKEEHPDANRPILDFLYMLNRNATFGTVALSARTIWNQVNAGIRTLAATGPTPMARGTLHYLVSPAERKFIEANSNLIGRKADLALSAFHDIVNGGSKMSKMDKLTQGITWADYFMSSMAWSSFYKYGKSIGFEGKDLIRYANDMVIKTQGSGLKMHLPRYMRGRGVLRQTYMLQNFVTNNFTWLTEDVLKLGTGVKRNNVKALKELSLLIGATAAWNWFNEDVLGIDSSEPTPIKAWTREMNKQDPSWGKAALSSGGQLAQMIPMFNTIRYGAGLGGVAISSGTKAVRSAWKGEYGDAIVSALKLAKVPEQPARMIKEWVSGDEVTLMKKMKEEEGKKKKSGLSPITGTPTNMGGKKNKSKEKTKTLRLVPIK